MVTNNLPPTPPKYTAENPKPVADRSHPPLKPVSPPVYPSCKHDHGHADYSCDSVAITGQVKLWCRRHYAPFYGECALHVQEEIRDFLRPAVTLDAAEPPVVDIEALVAVPSP